MMGHFKFLVLSALISGVASASPNLCANIFAEHSIQPALALTHLEVVSRIDSLIELQLRIQRKNFDSENQFIQALSFFERETKGLMLLDPSYQQLYKDRFFEVSHALNKKQSKADRLRQDDQRERNKRIKEAQVFNPKEKFSILHLEKVMSAVFSPDSKYIMTASEGRTGRLFELATQSEVASFTHEDFPHKRVIFSPNSKYVATSSYDKTAKIYDVMTKQELFSIQHMGTVLRSTFSPDSKYVVTASRDNTARIYEVATKQELYKIEHEGSVLSVVFSPDSKFVATASADRTAKIFEVATKKVLTSILHEGEVNGAVFSPDGQYVATASDDKTVKLTQLYQKLDEE